MVMPLYRDRREAGRVLGAQLAAYAGRADLRVLALPRGGVPVAFEVARALGAPLDVLVARKLGVPWHPEYAIGAIAQDVQVVDEERARKLGIHEDALRELLDNEQQELARRERLYRAGQPPLALQGCTVILVDDGLATGATMRAAARALRAMHPARSVLAAPVAAVQSCAALRAEADEVVCAATPEPFEAVGHWYVDFAQTSDDEVRALLAQATMPHAEETP